MHEKYLQRCCDLAMLSDAKVSPNPRVGAVLVYQDRIIGEGFHRQAGQAHAEVNCLASVKEEDRKFITESTIYVSLEPCCFHGRTPACTGLILDNKIPRVVIAQRDKTAAVNGQGVKILQDAGVEVVEFPDFEPAKRVVAPRQLFAAQERPFTLLKYAQSADGFLAPDAQKDYWITGKISRRIVHFWRSRTNAIVIGAGTLIADDPQLNLRLYPGPQPLAVIIDPKGRIRHDNYRVFQQEDRPHVFLLQPPCTTKLKKATQIFYDFPVFPAKNKDDYRSSKVGDANNEVYNIQFQAAARQLVQKINAVLHQYDCNHVTIEGGAWLLSVYLAANSWDEARVFTSKTVRFGSGTPAPISKGLQNRQITVEEDELSQIFPA